MNEINVIVNPLQWILFVKKTNLNDKII